MTSSTSHAPAVGPQGSSQPGNASPGIRANPSAPEIHATGEQTAAVFPFDRQFPRSRRSRSSDHRPRSARASASDKATAGGRISGYQIAMAVPSALLPKDSNISQRIQALNEYLGNAVRLMEQHPQEGLKIFLTPEYFFDRPLRPRPIPIKVRDRHMPGEVRQLTEAQYHQIDMELRELSKKYPDITIKVAVSWSKPAERPLTEEDYLASKAASDPGNPLHAHYKTQWENRNKESLISRKEKGREASAIGANEMGDRVAGFEDIDDDTTHLARNTVLTYFNGERTAKYHKIMGAREVLGMDDGTKVKFFSGKDYGGRHTLPDGAEATQEICRDHLMNTARQAGSIHFVHTDSGTAARRVPPDKYTNTSVVVHANSAYAHAYPMWGPPIPTQLQHVDMVAESPSGSPAANPIRPVAIEDGVELYNVNLTAEEK